jgi:hypothetical protein
VKFKTTKIRRKKKNFYYEGRDREGFKIWIFLQARQTARSTDTFDQLGMIKVTSEGMNCATSGFLHLHKLSLVHLT